MYISSLKVSNFRCIGIGAQALEVDFKRGLTTIIGANDAGKTAVIDALRFSLGTTDQERLWLEDSDFHPITIVCEFSDLNSGDLSTFPEFLTHGENDADKPMLIVNWIADPSGIFRGGRSHHRVEVRSGKDANGLWESRPLLFGLGRQSCQEWSRRLSR